MCEGYITVGCEAQFPALLEGQGIPFTFTDSAMLALCLDKKVKVRGIPLFPGPRQNSTYGP